MNAKKTAVSNGKAGKKKQQSSTGRMLRNFIRVLFIICFTLCVIFAGILGGMAFAYIKTAEPITSEQLMLKGFTTHVYDSDNKEILALQSEQNREMVDSKDIPQNLKDAYIAIEDKRFEEHHGVDFKRLTSAVINFILPGGSSHGGSTITQQVIKNVTGEDKKSIKRKVQEAWRAMELERNLTKDQILEIYMNLIYMGENCYGVQSASKTYFGKDVKDLTLAECASLAGITNLPGKYDPFTTKGRENNLKRQKIILKEMLDNNKIKKQEYDEAVKQELVFAESNRLKDKVASNQPYFVDQVILDVKKDLMAAGYSEDMAIKTIYNNGLKIYTCMDSEIQKTMDEVFLKNEYFTKINKNTSQSPQAAMVIIDPKTGQVRAMYGGAGEKIGIPFNRATALEKQPGSTIKPIAVYGPAINEGTITPATIIDDAPVRFDPNSNRLYPTNSGGKNDYDGLTSIHDGITRSVNVIAASVWKDYLGPDLSLKYLSKVGINRDKERNLSISMGGLAKGVSPLQMAAAYVPFVNKGIYYEPTTYTKVEDMNGNVILEKKPAHNIVYEEAAAYVMVNMLKDVVNSPDGTANRCKLQNGKMPTAGKTGTTDNNTNKWFVGFTTYYVGATWYGYDRNVPLTTNERNRAQFIWHEVMNKVHAKLDPVDFEKPSGIVKKTICKYSGKIATDLCAKDPRGSAVREEYFIKGTEPSDEDKCDVHVIARVCKDSTDIFKRNLLAGPYCPDGSVIEKVFIQRKKPYTPQSPGDPYPKDMPYELPAGEYCNIHGPREVNTPNNQGDTSKDNSLMDWFGNLFN